jgi:hypothetical protein
VKTTAAITLTAADASATTRVAAAASDNSSSHQYKGYKHNNTAVDTTKQL